MGRSFRAWRPRSQNAALPWSDRASRASQMEKWSKAEGESPAVAPDPEPSFILWKSLRPDGGPEPPKRRGLPSSHSESRRPSLDCPGLLPGPPPRFKVSGPALPLTFTWKTRRIKNWQSAPCTAGEGRGSGGTCPLRGLLRGCHGEARPCCPGPAAHPAPSNVSSGPA